MKAAFVAVCVDGYGRPSADPALKNVHMANASNKMR